MQWNEKRYHSLDYALKLQFGGKTAKLSLDGGCTCPNRDGSLSVNGCAFCDETGAGGYAFGKEKDIWTQIEEQKQIVTKKWNPVAYIGYFQRFTNTYGDVGFLGKQYRKALTHPDIRGIAIATRPDCLQPSKIKLLKDINENCFMWVELGLQTMHQETAEAMNIGYELACFETAVKQLIEKKIKVVVHVIFGLPGETREQMLQTIDYLATLPLWGIKIHMLNVVQGTAIASQYHHQAFELMTKEEYIGLVCDAIEQLPANWVIHRLTGDADHTKLIAPRWIKHKLGVLSGIDMELKRRKTYQGMRVLY